MSLMAFMLVMMLGLSTITQLELATASTTQDEQRARENARLGLLVALGKLQQNAGPDQRVTARADILGDGNFDPANRYWTGVWDTTDMDGDPVWLVSSNDNPATPGNPNSTVLLAGPSYFGNRIDEFVLVEKKPASEDRPEAAGNFAYWIADEGVKSSIAKNSNLAEYEENNEYADFGLNAQEFKRLRQISGDRPYWERMFSEVKKAAVSSGFQEDKWEETAGNQVFHANSFEQLQLIPALGAAKTGEEDTSEIQYHHPDVTLLARGVLANTKDGGLKKDLSNENLIDADAPFALNDEFWSFVNARPDHNDRAEFRGLATNLGDSSQSLSLAQGEPANPVGPILVEFALYFGVYRDEANSNDLRYNVYIQGDVWNPLATQMAFTPEGTNDLIFEIDVPMFTINWTSSPGTQNEDSGSITVNPSLLDMHNQNDDDFDIKSVPFDIYDKMAVGEVRKISERARGVLPNGLPRRVDTDEPVEIELWSAAVPVTVRLKTQDGRLIQEFKDIQFDGVDTAAVQNITLSTQQWPHYRQHHAVYHFKFHDEVQLGDLERWMSEVDPRSPVHDMSTNRADMFFVNTDPAEAVADESLFMGRPEFFYGGNYHRFFDSAATEPISLGLLQHLQFYDEEPFAIGNPWGEEKNSVFDRYFFSSLTEEHDFDQDLLPNHHLTKVSNASINPDNPDETAGAFLINGAFNLNSTSVKAWESALGAIHLYDWQYRINEGGTNPVTLQHVENAVFRFSHLADRSYTHPYSNGSARITSYPEATQQQRERWYRQHWQPDWAAAYTVGARQLRDGDNGDNIDDVQDLAQQIVTKIKERGKPYASIEDLLTDGLLQEAIDDTRINTVSDNIYSDENSFLKKFPRYCPSFVTQADIINVLAPFAQARSDTFVIRAYGEAVDPLSGDISGKAWCEALVQRTPSPTDADATTDVAEYISPTTTTGRKFEIIEFRWLNENEI